MLFLIDFIYSTFIKSKITYTKIKKNIDSIINKPQSKEYELLKEVFLEDDYTVFPVYDDRAVSVLTRYGIIKPYSQELQADYDDGCLHRKYGLTIYAEKILEKHKNLSKDWFKQ